MQASIKSVKGENLKSIKFPGQFSEPVRPDLIGRAVFTIQNNRRQPYGAKPEAGKRASAKLSRRRRDFRGSYGIGISRVPRKALNNRGTRFFWVGAFSPNTVGGRRAHPPKADKIWDKKLNKKERRKAIRSALSAVISRDLVLERGHIVDDYPLVIEAKAEDIAKTKDAVTLLNALGLKDELARVEERKVRAGKGKMRGRRYKQKKGPLVVVSKDCRLLKSLSNLPGIDCVVVDKLNTELLAPGALYGRLTVFTEDSITRIEKESLFAK